MTTIPRKLKKDSIAEALLEVRFECAEVAEVVIGSLLSHGKWKSYLKRRLPIADVPPPIRDQDPTLRHQPVLECWNQETTRAVKMGSNVVSYHVLAPYPGWTVFRGELEEAVDYVFSSLNGFRAHRLGLRYVNLLNKHDHHISNVTELNQRIQVAGEELGGPLNLNYQRARGPEHIAVVRIASPEFVATAPNVLIAALVDVDVFTPEGFTTESFAAAKQWLNKAHDVEKEEFFKLIPNNVLNELREDKIWIRALCPL